MVALGLRLWLLSLDLRNDVHIPSLLRCENCVLYHTTVASSIPPLNREGIIYCNDNYKANILNQCFIEQTVIEEENATLPTTLPLPAHKFDSITVTPDDVESTVKTLQLGKAAGPDAINNRILKELADPVSLPLLVSLTTFCLQVSFLAFGN